MENMIVKTVFEICKSAETITFAYIVYPLTWCECSVVCVCVVQTHTTLHLCCLNFVAQ